MYNNGEANAGSSSTLLQQQLALQKQQQQYSAQQQRNASQQQQQHQQLQAQLSAANGSGQPGPAGALPSARPSPAAPPLQQQQPLHPNAARLRDIAESLSGMTKDKYLSLPPDQQERVRNLFAQHKLLTQPRSQQQGALGLGYPSTPTGQPPSLAGLPATLVNGNGQAPAPNNTTAPGPGALPSSAPTAPPIQQKRSGTSSSTPGAPRQRTFMQTLAEFHVSQRTGVVFTSPEIEGRIVDMLRLYKCM